MVNTLVAPADVADFPGAPFAESILDSVVGRLRDDAGWHIAPSVTETITVDGTSGRKLVLPSLRVTAVTEVRDVTDPANPVVLADWRVKSYGILIRDYWPCEDESIEVDLTHGHDATPESLLALVASIANAAGQDFTVAEEDAGPFGVKRSNLSTLAAYNASETSALDPYRVRSGF